MRYREQRIRALAARKTQVLAIPTLLLAGCAAPVAQLSSEIPRQAAPAAIRGAISGMDDAATRRRLERIMGSPEMRDLQRDLISGLLDGALATLDDQARTERIGALTSKALSGTL